MSVIIKKGCDRDKVMATIKMLLQGGLVKGIQHQFNADHSEWQLTIDGDFDNY